VEVDGAFPLRPRVDARITVTVTAPCGGIIIITIIIIITGAAELQPAGYGRSPRRQQELVVKGVVLMMVQLKDILD